MSYQNSDIEEELHKEANTPFKIVGTLCLISIIIGTVGIVFASHYQDPVCFSHKFIMSINQWLIIISSINMVALCIISPLMYSTFGSIQELSIMDKKFTAFAVIIFLYVMFLILMIILGIVELVHQFPYCSNNVVIIYSIATVIFEYSVNIIAAYYCFQIYRQWLCCLAFSLVRQQKLNMNDIMEDLALYLVL